MSRPGDHSQPAPFDGATLLNLLAEVDADEMLRLLSAAYPRRLLTPRNDYNARMVAEAVQQRRALRAADELTAEAQRLGLEY